MIWVGGEGRVMLKSFIEKHKTPSLYGGGRGRDGGWSFSFCVSTYQQNVEAIQLSNNIWFLAGEMDV